MLLGADFGVRPLEARDRGFVVSSWLRDLRDHSPYWRKLHPEDYQALMPLAIDRMLDAARCLVAHDLERPEVIYGFLAYQPRHLLLYAYVKRAWRRMGVARALLGVSGLETPYICPYLTSGGEDSLRGAGVEWRFNPLATFSLLQ